MPSALYQKARAALSDEERKDLGHAEARLAGALPEEDGYQISGGGVLDNIRLEAHLTGDGPYGEPAEFSQFLAKWAALHEAAGSEDGRREAYSEACHGFSLRGLPVPRSVWPPVLLRYVTGRRVVEVLVERVLGRKACDDLKSRRIEIEDTLAKLATDWDPAPLEDGDRLARGEVVFATFEFGAPARLPRGDARQIAEALGLRAAARRPGREDVLVELTYPAKRVGRIRVPTVADAEWNDLFDPAPERVPDPGQPETCYGWTRPLGPQVPQPEVVHENRSLKVLTGPPRLVGRLRP